MTRFNDLRFLLSVVGLTIVIVRHGKTTKNDDDMQRQLTPEGVEQARQFRAYLAREIAKRNIGAVGYVVSSIASRAIATVSDPTWPPPTPLEELYIPGKGTALGEALDAMTKKLGLVPLDTYFTDETSNETHLMEWGDRAFEKVEKMLWSLGVGPHSTIPIGCHAVLGPTLALAIVRGISGPSEVEKLITSLNLHEGEAIVCGISGTSEAEKLITGLSLGEGEAIVIRMSKEGVVQASHVTRAMIEAVALVV